MDTGQNQPKRRIELAARSPKPAVESTVTARRACESRRFHQFSGIARAAFESGSAKVGAH
jgi:hypothetical protein